ncbi:MAG: T9SS type A sorting domain-containing protein [Flavobacteriales bacterium]|nr:T9SS type A sorting domain-containing protein [Flavobacteriales bacterium]
MKKSIYSQIGILTVIVACSVISLNSQAQGVVNNGAKINIATGTYFNIDNGGFTNESGGEVTNAGTMQVDGTWENNDAGGVFATNNGVVQLDGAAQDITGSEPTDFYTVVVQGTAHKTLNGVDANVYNNLNLNGKSLRLNTNTLNIETSSTAAITGAGKIISETGPASGGYGVLRWNIGTNTGNYTIPFGTDVATPTDLSFGYNITTAGLPSSNYKTFSTYVTDSENSFTGTNITVNPLNNQWTDLPTSVTNLTDDYIQAAHYWTVDRFWIIDAENIGVGMSGYASAPRIEYAFKYAQTEVAAPNHIDETKLAPQRWNHTLNKWGDWLYGVPAVITNPATNTTTVQIAQDGSTWEEDMYPVWTLVDNSDPLPIEIVRFAGECAGGSIDVRWTTWTETNNDFFTLERSNNGSDFEIVDVIEGAGNSNEPISYNVKDEEAYSGTSYYRLKDTDFAGKSTYSEVVAVTCGDDVNDFNFVNAYDVDQTEVVVEFTGTENEDFKIVLFDASGKKILDYANTAVDGMNKVRLNTGVLASGIYIVNLSNSTKNFSKRVMLK